MYKVFIRHHLHEPLKIKKRFVPHSWVHLEEPSQEEIESIVDQFNLDPVIIDDALDLFEVPRVEKEGNVIYYFTRYATYSPELDHISTLPLLIILGRNFFITICASEFPNLRRFAEGKIEFQTNHKAQLLGQILESIDDEYESLTKKLSKLIMQQSSNLEKITNQRITQFVNFENVLDDLLFGLYPTSLTLNKLLKGKLIKFSPDDEELIKDLIQNNEQLIKMCESNSKRVISTREAYANILSNNLNKIMKILTAATVLLTIPTMISGIFGMNVNIPLANHPLGFWIIILTTAFSSITLLVIFLKQDWI